jgi:hypothetical protein
LAPKLLSPRAIEAWRGAGRIAPPALTGEKERGFGALPTLRGSPWDGVGAKDRLSSARGSAFRRKEKDWREKKA